MGIHVGFLGAGRFATTFIPLFQAHPGVDSVSIAEPSEERREAVRSQFVLKHTVDGLEKLLDTDVDAVAIFTPRWMHGPQAVEALFAGKHVYSAVPMGITLEELSSIIEASERSQRVYMMGETSFYYPAAIFCRNRFREGAFGKFVYAEGQYLHDMEHFYQHFQQCGLENWRAAASFPPMLYPSHSVSIVLSVTGEIITSVSCLGWIDQHEDGIFRKELSMWGNEFSNESALFRTSDGGMVRVNEMRRIGTPYNHRWEVTLSMYGTRAAFVQAGGQSTWGTFLGGEADITDYLTCAPDPHSGFAAVHAIDRLPSELKGLPSGHLGSHQFLVDDFVAACTGQRAPSVDARRAASYCAPGIVAHESALREGQLMEVPRYL